MEALVKQTILPNRSMRSSLGLNFKSIMNVGD
jgi:hypothetical protein